MDVVKELVADNVVADERMVKGDKAGEVKMDEQEAIVQESLVEALK